MEQSGTATAACDKHAEALAQPPPYNPREPLPPIGGPTATAPPPAAQYTSPTYQSHPPATIQPQQHQQQHYNQQNQSQDNDAQHPHNGPGSRKGWADTSARVCAVFQILCGLVMFIFHIAAIVIDSNLHESGYGIWGGLFMLITGIVGVVAANKKSTGSIVAFMILSIITAVLCLPLLVLSAVGLHKDIEGDTDYFWGFYFRHDNVSNKTRAAMNGIMMIAIIIESIVAITSSALCCRATCCGENTRSPGPNQVNVVYVGHVPYAAPQYGQQQVMFLAPNQYHMFSHQMSPHQPYGMGMSVTHGGTQSVLTQQANMHQAVLT